MEERLSLYQNGAPAGLLLRREDGLHTVFTADCPGGGGEVRKLWLHAPSGTSLLLGTLAPENGRWRLTRRLARSSLERQGLTGELWGELIAGSAQPQQSPPPPAKQSCGRLPLTPEDSVIAAALHAAPNGRWQRQGEHWQLTLPWQVGQPFPLLPLFCFARPGRCELCFLLGEKGYPVFF